MTALEVEDLRIVGTDGRALVRDLSFSLAPGERLGLIGESGSGKSLTALSIIGLLPEGLEPRGSIGLGGTQIVGASESTMNRLRGRAAGIVFQEPLTALDPLMRLGAQLAEPLRRRARAEGARLDRRRLAAAVTAALEEVSLGDTDRIARAYPHEVSGGQRQRVAIAIALAGRPELLIADEPTTALDVTIQSEILDLLDRIVRDRGMSLLFIGHDLAVVARVADRVIVLKDGQPVEQGRLTELLTAARHPYTRDLVASARKLDEALDRSATS
ncbi:MAG TPA: ABC transporter ATP-binding protein [Lacisediminihabitans sp.]|uniref:ABC transporter ATP-binding protein n=1 Tax=Lacisediminihabitans sp. TaxID=2787631 RepID=UPI002EDB2246